VGLSGATGLLTKEDQHQIHRAALASAINSKFAKGIPDLIHTRVENLMQRIMTFGKDQGSVNISDAFRSLSHEVMSSIFVGSSEDSESLLNRPDLGHSALKTYRALFQCAAWHRQFPFLGPLVKTMPDWVVKHIVPYLLFERVCKC
jgi:hypothetical protein